MRTGIALLWISFVLECLLSFKIVPAILAEIGEVVDSYLFWVAVAAAVLISAFVAFLIALTALRRNWARILYLVIYLLGVPSFLMSIGSAFEESLPVALGSTASNLLQIVALVFLFLPVSNAWFRTRHSVA